MGYPDQGQGQYFPGDQGGSGQQQPGGFGQQPGSFGQQPGGYQQPGNYPQYGGNYPQQSGYPGGQPTWQAGGGYPATKTNGLAIAALVCGIGQILLGLIAGIPAIIMGHIARRQIRQTGEGGAGMAMAGLVLGYLGVALSVIFIIAIVAAAGHTST